MKSRLLWTAFAVLAIASAGSAWAQEASEGERIAHDVCANCHGPDGNSTSPLFPRLAGQQEEYLEVQLDAFRDHTRADPHARAFMWGMAQSLTADSIKQLAHYYARQKPAAMPAVDTPLAAQGKKLYENGAPDHGVPACITCHGDKATGDGAIPRLAGQHGTYLVKQLEAFRSMLRANDVMHENTKNIDNDQISALAAYLGTQ